MYIETLETDVKIKNPVVSNTNNGNKIESP